MEEERDDHEYIKIAAFAPFSLTTFDQNNLLFLFSSFVKSAVVILLFCCEFGLLFTDDAIFCLV